MKIGIVGATGEVGRTMIEVLEKMNIPVSELRLFASKKSAGKTLIFKGKKYIVEELKKDHMMEKYDYIFFSAGIDISKKFAPIAADIGNTVIDNSSAFRLEKEIPLVVPEINWHLLRGYKGIIANPNCSTIQMVLSLYKVHRIYGIKEIVVSTYQAVSGAGRKGIVELQAQMNGEDVISVFPKKILGNVIPLIGPIKENRYTQEEIKMVNETRKILNDPNIIVHPTAVRVPVFYGHSESIFVRLMKPFKNLEELKTVLSSSENVVVTDDIITPLDIKGSDLTYICRVRAFDNISFSFWNVADNVRVGAATNAVRILKKHMELNGVML